MTKLPKFLLRCSLFAFAPIAAHAAGTYYNNGMYQSPQRSYAAPGYAQQGYVQRQNTYAAPSGYNNGYAGYNNSGYYNNNQGYASTRYNPQQQQGYNRNMNQGQSQQQSGPATPGNANSNKSGFYLDAGLSHQSAMWSFEMKEAGSKLHYDNISWNIFDVSAGYQFQAGNTPMEITAGFKYGMQSGDSTMVDDDITGGGYLSVAYKDELDNIIAKQFGHALSIGTSSGGNMMEFNVGFGLTDFFKWGNARITPSIGYRYMKYKLETKKNYGLAIDTIDINGACIEINGEIQCDPVYVIYTMDEYGDIIDSAIVTRQILENGQLWGVPVVSDLIGGQEYVSADGTYYYQQPGVSHSYEVEWAGPYLALDMDYTINNNNAVNGHVEVGLPAYTATGDQPYRMDWNHPTSVKDKAGIGDAFHIGLGANWTTALTDSVSLSLGMTYDYYTVKGADVTTYLNAAWYQEQYDKRLQVWLAQDKTQADMEENDEVVAAINETKDRCPGWVCKESNEIDSFYKSLGIRVGLNARF